MRERPWREARLGGLLLRQFPGAWGDEPTLGSKPNASVLRSTNLDDDGHIDLSTGAPRCLSSAELSEKRLLDGDLLVEASGGGPGKPVGRVALFQEIDDLVYVSSNFFRTLRVNRLHAEPSFLFWKLHWLHKQPEIWRFQQQTTGIINLRYSDYLNYKFALPSLAEQRQIAEILDALDNCIQSKELSISKLENQRQGLLEQLVLGEAARFPVWTHRSLSTRIGNGWRPIRLRDAGRWLSGGTPSTDDPRYWGGEIPWISAASLKNFRISDSERRITNLGARSGTRLVPTGTVVFVVRGMSLKNEFRVGVAQRQLAFGQDCKAIVPTREVDGTFLAIAIKARTNEILSMVDEAGHGTGRLPTDLISHLEVGVPPMFEQQRIVSILGECDEVVDRMRMELAKLRLLEQGLTDDLLTGRVRVPLSHHEPA